MPGVALGVDGLPVFVRRSRTVLQCHGLVANVTGDLPFLLVCHLFDAGAGGGRFIPTGFPPVQRLTEQSALTNRGAYATALFLTAKSLAGTFDLEGAKRLKTKARSFGEFRLTAIRQNHKIKTGCRTSPVQPQTSAPSFNGRTADLGKCF
jgi:hypothetical protein